MLKRYNLYCILSVLALLSYGSANADLVGDVVNASSVGALSSVVPSSAVVSSSSTEFSFSGVDDFSFRMSALADFEATPGHLLVGVNAVSLSRISELTFDAVLNDFLTASIVSAGAAYVAPSVSIINGNLVVQWQAFNGPASNEVLDIVYTTTILPEPGTYFVLASFIAGALLLVRRRKALLL